MAFDGFVTKAIVSELKQTLIGAKVNKIFEPTKNDIILNLYKNGFNYNLNICINPEYCRICLTNHLKPNPQNAYNFCMLLRKYLTSSKIINISSYDLERTIEIKFETYNELNDLVIRKLYIEIMSRQSNIILTTENNIIIDTLKHSDTNVRELLPAHEYSFTPITKLSFCKYDFEEFYKFIIDSNPNNLSDFLSNSFIGFSKNFINETLNKLNISNTQIDKDNILKLYNYIKTLISNLGTNKVYCEETSKKDYTIFYNNSLNNNTTLQINYFVDEFYYKKEQENLFITSRNNLLKIVSSYLKKVYKKLENINVKLKECEEKDKYKLYGELLTANLYRVDSSFNYETFTVENYYDNNNLITIPLDIKISVQKNIEKYFKKYNKLKNALTIVEKQKKEAQQELNYIESIVFNLSNAKTLNDINEVYEEIAQNISTKQIINKQIKNKNSNKQSNKAIELETIVIDNFTIYIGKNNIQNDYISLKFSNKNDIWFHAQKIHGSHILLRNPDNLEIDEIPEKILFNCALLAKQNSKASSSLNVPVDYCYAKFVKKAAGSKPGMVIYNNFKTIIVK